MAPGERRRRSVIAKLVELAITLSVLLLPTSALALTRASVVENASALAARNAKTRVRGFELGPAEIASGFELSSARNASGKSARERGEGVRVHHSNRVWSPDLAAFLSPDEFGYLTKAGTLWSWPKQNPMTYRDPEGRGIPLLLFGLWFILNDLVADTPQAAPPSAGGSCPRFPGMGDELGPIGRDTILAMSIGRGRISVPGEPTTNLYRAVGERELADIMEKQVFRTLEGQEVKYFSTSAEGTASYAQQAAKGFGEGPFTIVQSSMPSRMISAEMRATVDRGISTVVVPNQSLPSLSTPQVLNYTPLP